MTEIRVRLNDEQNRKLELMKPIFRVKSKENMILKLIDLTNIKEPDSEGILEAFK